jgi:hypothetical protein
VGDGDVVVSARSTGLSTYETVTISFYPNLVFSMFHLANGMLNVIYLNILHNNISGGVIFNVVGIGTLTIRSCNVYGSTNPEIISICNYTFIQTNGNSSISILSTTFGNLTFRSNSLVTFIGDYGNITITQSTFEYILSNGTEGVLISTPSSSGSVNSYLISLTNIFVYNVTTMYNASSTTSGSGGLISVYQTTQSISLSNSEFEDVVVGGNTNGGIIYVGSGTTVGISECSFENIGTSWNGGILYVSSCTGLVSISSSVFLSISVSGNGGAIYFGGDTSFGVSSSTFGFCTANGFGGAIASNSTKEGNRALSNDLFEENTGNGGNDYCDVSPSDTSVLYYNSTSISGVSSLSLAPSLFYNYIGVCFDCLITGDCVQNIVGVSATTGTDAPFCGNLSFQCKTLVYSLNTVLRSGGQVILNSGDYSKNNTQILKNFTLIGNSSNSSTYPKISLESTSSGVLFNGTNRVYQFSYLKFVHSSTSSVGNSLFITSLK